MYRNTDTQPEETINYNAIFPGFRKLSEEQTNELQSRFCVTPPYYALNNLHYNQDTKELGAIIVPEMDRGGDKFLVSGAEMGRHGAIAGLAAIAFHQAVNKKHAYLAHKASLTRLNDGNVDNGVISIRSKVDPNKKKTDTKNREGHATSIIYVNETAFYQLNTTYQITRPALLTRAAKTARIEGLTISPPDPAMLKSPYTQPLPLEDIKFYGQDCNMAVARLKNVTPWHCAGHFNQAAFLPVAHICGTFISLIECTLPDGEHASYQVQLAEIFAEEFVPFNADVTFHVIRGETNGNVVTYTCAARNNGKDVAGMTINLDMT